MPANILSAALIGVDAAPIEIESDVANGLPAFVIVGLPDAAVQEARDRVKTALKNSGFSFPRTRLTVNLAPADLRKAGPAFDLPIAVSIMVGSGELKYEAVQGALFLGELALDGSLRPVAGVLAATLLAKKLGATRIFVPKENASEAALVPNIQVFGVPTLSVLAEHLHGIHVFEPHHATEPADDDVGESGYDFASIAGLEQAKRALEIAAAGGHNILLSGSPGAGKTLLARSIPSILPRMTYEEALEATRIHSVAHLLPRSSPLLQSRPWRAPHHTASTAAIIGGGTNPHPGEVTLAHRGVLFLDEFPEFPRPVLEGLRQPLEDRRVTVSRASGTLEFPASFMLVAARNPCPCGFFGDPERACVCTPSSLERYRKKISGPLLDRIDLYVEVPRTPYEKLAAAGEAETSFVVRGRVSAARDAQSRRNAFFGAITNADIRGRDLKKICVIPREAETLLLAASKALHLSPRAIHRCLKVARTIADLAERERIETPDVAEALQYRPKQE
ncbi:MAG: YifB family Mg chelatase-like AAA ATPase [Patescibacteria group bacterium]|jgi:magnesium chelatase family protein